MRRISWFVVVLTFVLVFSGTAPAFPLVKDIGGDGKDDAAVMYDYGSGKLTFWAFDFASSPHKLWSSSGGWWAANCDPVLDDVTGDGQADIVVRYDYGNSTTGMWVIPGSSGSSSPRLWWKSGIGSWNASHMKLTTSKAFSGTGPANPVVLYDYGKSTCGLWVFKKGSGSSFSPSLVWKSSVGSWNWSHCKIVGGDFNDDGKGDVAILYDYGNNTTGLWVFTSSGSKYSSKLVWKSSAGTWSWDKCRPMVGDVNGDGKDEVVVVYRYPQVSNGHPMRDLIGYWVFTPGGATVKPGLWLKTGAIAEWASSQFTVGDTGGDAIDDIVLFHGTSARSCIEEMSSTGSAFRAGYTTLWSSTSWYSSKSRLIP